MRHGAEHDVHGFVTDGKHDLTGEGSELTPEEQTHLKEELAKTEVPAIIALGLAQETPAPEEADETKSE